MRLPVSSNLPNFIIISFYSENIDKSNEELENRVKIITKKIIVIILIIVVGVVIGYVAILRQSFIHASDV
ncbi:hypothetical protein [Methanobrevibacter sp.]|uniref:hypothetical protein n=1 Tax=Methanobrevibacter sp. TaxID=66852 RepID=UPI0025D008F3|nr:hypothetical protein [Methanobrevibacter sp.]MBQ2665183.1 hypothetical protein [Methanobrevibacter sp.]